MRKSATVVAVEDEVPGFVVGKLGHSSASYLLGSRAVALVTALKTGLRVGESILALKWEDLDLVAGQLVVAEPSGTTRRGRRRAAATARCRFPTTTRSPCSRRTVTLKGPWFLQRTGAGSHSRVKNMV